MLTLFRTNLKFVIQAWTIIESNDEKHSQCDNVNIYF